ELTLDVVPVLLGSGERLFDGVESLGFEPVEVLHSPLATHIRYRRAGGGADFWGAGDAQGHIENFPGLPRLPPVRPVLEYSEISRNPREWLPWPRRHMPEGRRRSCWALRGMSAYRYGRSKHRAPG